MTSLRKKGISLSRKQPGHFRKTGFCRRQRLRPEQFRVPLDLAAVTGHAKTKLSLLQG